MPGKIVFTGLASTRFPHFIIENLWKKFFFSFMKIMEFICGNL